MCEWLLPFFHVRKSKTDASAKLPREVPGVDKFARLYETTPANGRNGLRQGLAVVAYSFHLVTWLGTDLRSPYSTLL